MFTQLHTTSHSIYSRTELYWKSESVLGARRSSDARFSVVCTATWNFITSGKSHVVVLDARRSSDACFWGVETPLSEVNALYRVHSSLLMASNTFVLNLLYFFGNYSN